MSERVARQVIYGGRVQGVGFRRQTERVAEGFAVAGYVRNLADGRVELLAEGDAGEVERFLSAVSDRLAGYIARADATDLAPGGHAAFVIRRD